MAYEKPDESLELPMRSRSLNIVLGATEYLFIAGLTLLAIGLVSVFGIGWAFIGCGAALVVTAWVDAVAS